MKYIFFIMFSLLSMSSVAGGVTNAATPTRIDIIQSTGFMVYGDFGNPNSCTNANYVFVKASAPQYNQIYSAVLAAYMAGKKVRFYANVCEPIGWYAVLSVTYNIVTADGAFYFSE